MDGVVYTGVPSVEELKECPGRPSVKRTERGKVACIECVQEIPCNPCENACPFGAIQVGQPITSLPVLLEDKCIGCGLCVASCPGLAITLISRNAAEKTGTVDFPYEYRPLPKEGDTVLAVGRDGRAVCDGTVLRIMKNKQYDGTVVISISVPLPFVDEVRSMKRLARTDAGRE